MITPVTFKDRQSSYIETVTIELPEWSVLWRLRRVARILSRAAWARYRPIEIQTSPRIRIEFSHGDANSAESFATLLAHDLGWTDTRRAER